MLEQPTYQLKQAMVEWLGLIEEIMRIANRLAKSNVKSLTTDPHISTLSSSNSSVTATPSVQIPVNTPYAQFRLAAHTLQLHQLQQLAPAQREYESLKLIYQQLSQHLMVYKQKRASIMTQPEQLKQWLNVNGLNVSGLNVNGLGSLPVTVNSMTSSTTFDSLSLLTRPDLHHLVNSNHTIESIERRARDLQHQLQTLSIPKVTKLVSSTKQWERASTFVANIPGWTNEWSSTLSDESRLIQAIRSHRHLFAQQTMGQMQVAHFEIETNLSTVKEVHHKGGDHVLASLRKSTQDMLTTLQSTWSAMQPQVQDLFLL
ncbi:MAG: hypothetical protein Sylvanvirus45_1, partial [Sylvanvirus sp.]